MEVESDARMDLFIVFSKGTPESPLSCLSKFVIKIEWNKLP